MHFCQYFFSFSKKFIFCLCFIIKSHTKSNSKKTGENTCNIGIKRKVKNKIPTAKRQQTHSKTTAKQQQTNTYKERKERE